MLRQKPPKLVTISVITSVTLIFWVFFSLYQTLTKKPVTETPEVVLEQINPSLDQSTLNSIESRGYYDEGQVEEIQSSPSTPLETPEETPLLDPTIEEENLQD